MSLLSPLICGSWDACHVWAQWTPLAGARYFLEWRFRGTPSAKGQGIPAAGEWSQWYRVGGEQGLERPWLSLALHRAQCEVQVRVAAAGKDPAWELAQEVTFSKSTCRFVVRSAFRSVQIDRGVIVDCVVDNAPASYRLLPPAQSVMIPAGGEMEMDAEALHPTGWMQLDHPGHFCITPQLGVTIENIQPSQNDITPTGRDFTLMQSLVHPEGTPIRLVVKRQNIR